MPYKLHKEFYEKLKQIDPYLDAIFDEKRVEIVVWAARPGKPKIHEYSQPLHFIDPDTGLEVRLQIQDLEDYTIRVLKESDIWQKYGTGKAYDDALFENQKEHERKAKESFRKERIARLKDERQLFRAALWNAAHGRFTKETVLPWNTPTEAVGIDLKEREMKSEKPEEIKNAST